MCYFLQCICHIPELRSSGIWIGPREPLMREEHDIATIPGTFSFKGHMIQMGNCYEFSRRLNARLGKQYLFGSVWNPHEICAATGSPTLADSCCILWRIHHDEEVLVPQGLLGSLRKWQSQIQTGTASIEITLDMYGYVSIKWNEKVTSAGPKTCMHLKTIRTTLWDCCLTCGLHLRRQQLECHAEWWDPNGIQMGSKWVHRDLDLKWRTEPGATNS